MALDKPYSLGRVRIASLVPSATEALFALGLGDDVVAVTHECDWPAAARELPQLTRSVIPEGLPPAEIDAAVRELTAQGEAIYELDEDDARAARARPDRDAGAVRRLRRLLRRRLRGRRAACRASPRCSRSTRRRSTRCSPTCPRSAAACGVPRARRAPARRAARAHRRGPRARSTGAPRPRVAGARVARPAVHRRPLGAGDDRRGRRRSTRSGAAGVKSRTATWDELRAAEPDVVVVMPCGLYADEAAAQAPAHADELAALGAGASCAVDAASSFSRPGPRLVDGVELLGAPAPSRSWSTRAGPAWRGRRPDLRELGRGLAEARRARCRPRRPCSRRRRRRRARRSRPTRAAGRRGRGARPTAIASAASAAGDQAADVAADR